MKKLFKLLGVVLAASFLLVMSSCGEDEIIKKGGTINVVNATTNITYVLVVKGTDYTGALATLGTGGGTLIAAGATQPFPFTEDGMYTVVSLLPKQLIEPVLLSLGQTKIVRIE